MVDSILTIAIKNTADYFITGDADGAMRVWTFNGPKLLNLIDSTHESKENIKSWINVRITLLDRNFKR